MREQNRLDRRNALKLLGASFAGASLLKPSKVSADTQLSMPASHKHARIVIVGGGTGGMITAARLRRSTPNAEIIVISPNEMHLYQPGQTYVAAGLYEQSDNERRMADLMEDGVKWLQEHVISFEPQKNTLHTDKTGKIVYDYLVVALGVEYDYEAIEGLSKELIGRHAIASVYLNDTKTGKAEGGEITRQWMQQICETAAAQPVKVLCSEPATLFKGPGTPLDILFLTQDAVRGNAPFNKKDVHKNVEFTYTTPRVDLFESKEFSKVLEKELKNSSNTRALYRQELIAIDPLKKIAKLRHMDGKITEESYDFLHITPPMKPPNVLATSPLAIKEGKHKGYLDIDKKTLRHKRYENVFGIGDILGLELGKSGGSAQVQGVILQDNIAAALEELQLPMKYNGYTAAPIKTKYGEILLAEYNEEKALPTFWLDPHKPRWIWWELDLHLLRYFYFSWMMRGMF